MITSKTQNPNCTNIRGIHWPTKREGRNIWSNYSHALIADLSFRNSSLLMESKSQQWIPQPSRRLISLSILNPIGNIPNEAFHVSYLNSWNIPLKTETDINTWSYNLKMNSKVLLWVHFFIRRRDRQKGDKKGSARPWGTSGVPKKLNKLCSFRRDRDPCFLIKCVEDKGPGKYCQE